MSERVSAERLALAIEVSEDYVKSHPEASQFIMYDLGTMILYDLRDARARLALTDPVVRAAKAWVMARWEGPGCEALADAEDRLATATNALAEGRAE